MRYRWGDRGHKFERLNGLAFLAQDLLSRKIRVAAFDGKLRCREKVWFYQIDSDEEPLEKTP